MPATIEKIAAKSVFDPPTYAQAIKVTGAQTILFISGQVDYDAKGQPGHPGDFAGQARATFSGLKKSRLPAVPWATSSSSTRI